MSMLKKTGHMVLVLLLFLTTTGMTVSVHYCNHALYDIGIFSSAESCCAPLGTGHKKDAHHFCTLDGNHQDHCEDQSIVVEPVDDFFSSAYRADFRHQIDADVPLLSTYASGLFFRASSHMAEISERDNAPPGIKVEPSFLQSFLI
jgi:hypothetical protein